MKKSIKLLVLSMLAVGALTACQVGQKSSSGSEAPSSGDTSTPDSSKSSEQPSSEESSSEEPPVPTRDWTNEEKALMEQHLHGIVLPFLDVEGITLTFDETTEKFSTGALTIEDGTIAAYAELFDASEGWNDVSYQYSVYSTAPAGSFYVFERFVQTQEGKRGISVQFFGNDGSSYTTAGPMYLYASDPFDYEFPDLEAEYAQYNVDGAPIPAPNNQDLYFEFVPNSNNAAYHAYGWDEYLNATIYIYGLDEDGFLAYAQQCIAAGWTIEDGEYEDSYVATYVNESEETQFTVDVYFTEDYVALSFYYMAEAIPITTWAGVVEAMNAILQEYELEPLPFAVPAYEGQGFEYDVQDWVENYGEIDILITGTTSSDEALYGAILEEAGWTVDLDNGVATFETADGVAKLEFFYSSYSGGLYIYVFLDLEPLPSAEWPTADIAALLASLDSSITDVLPEYEYAPAGTTFQIYNDSYGAGVLIKLADGETEEGTIELYAYYLTEAGFTAVEGQDGFYESPNGQYLVELYSGEAGYVAIEVSVPVNYPTDEVNAAVETLLGEALTNVIPAAEGANDYYVYTGSADMVQVQCNFGSSASAALTAYKAALEAAGYIYAGDDIYGSSYYNTVDEQIYLSVWVYQSQYLIIEVYAGSYEATDTSVWPAETIMSLLQGLNPDITDVLPECLNGAAYDAHLADEDDTYADVKVIVSPAEGYTAAQIIAAFNAALEEAGFVKSDEDDYGVYYDSPNGQYNVCAWVGGSNVIIDILLIA